MPLAFLKLVLEFIRPARRRRKPHPCGVPTMPELTQATKDLITQALVDRDAAGASDADVALKVAATATAISAEQSSKDADLLAHQTSSASAHAALDAVMAEFGIVPMPGP